jgi:hypothetical protein
MAKHAMAEERPSKHGLEYFTALDLATLSPNEQHQVNYASTPDLAIYYYIHFKYGIHRWLGSVEDYCTGCSLTGEEVSQPSAWYAEYEVREWSL